MFLYVLLNFSMLFTLEQENYTSIRIYKIDKKGLHILTIHLSFENQAHIVK